MKSAIFKWTSILGLTLLAHIGIFNLITPSEPSSILVSEKTSESELLNLDLLTISEPTSSTSISETKQKLKDALDKKRNKEINKERTLQLKAEEEQRLKKIKEEKAKAKAASNRAKLEAVAQLKAKEQAEANKRAAEIKELQRLEQKKKAEEIAQQEAMAAAATLAKEAADRLAKATKLKEEKLKQANAAKAAKLKAQKAAKQATQQALIKKIISPAHAIKKNNPIYPKRLERKRTEGTVKLKLIISNTGLIKSITVSQSSGHKDFDNSALKAIKSWKYQAAKNGLGDSIETTIIETCIFRRN